MISIDLHRSDLATVTITPPLVARVLFRARTSDRFAIRSGSAWSWDDTGRLVPAHVQDALERARSAARRSAATLPPS